MANFVINQTASEIQQILNKADTPDTTPTPNSQNLVESGGVKTYVDTQVSQGASITTNSFAPSALEKSTDGISATDDAIPTSGLVNKLYGLSTNVDTLTQANDQSRNFHNVQAGESPETILVNNANSNNITGSGSSLTIEQGVYEVSFSTDMKVGQYTQGYIQASFGSTYASALDWNSNTLQSGVFRVSINNVSSGSNSDVKNFSFNGPIYLPSSSNVYITYWVLGAGGQARTVYTYNTTLQFFKVL